MFNWLKEYLELKMSYAERKREISVCESCETLKLQLSISNQERERLLDRILLVPSSPPAIDTDELVPIMPKTVPWRVRQQHLEAEDRERAKLINQQSNLNQQSNITIENLEKELGIVEAARSLVGESNATK